jgi:hypothetical protein
MPFRKPMLLLLFFASTVHSADVKSQIQNIYSVSTLADRAKRPVLVCLTDQIPASVIPHGMPADIAFSNPGTNIKIEIVNGQITRTKGKAHTHLSKGDLLFVGYCKVTNDYIRLNLFTISPHIMRTVVSAPGKMVPGELLGVDVIFKFPPPLLKYNDLKPIHAAVENWFKAFDDIDSATKFASPISLGQPLNIIKIGSTREDVEKYLGKPDKIYRYPDKIEYKFKEFTLELKNNVVTDIIY